MLYLTTLAPRSRRSPGPSSCCPRPQRILYVTSLFQSALMSGEFLTPLFPHMFLPLASLANLGKAVALSAFVAVTPSFQHALCKGSNLADITAKNQAQVRGSTECGVRGTGPHDVVSESTGCGTEEDRMWYGAQHLGDTAALLMVCSMHVPVGWKRNGRAGIKDGMGHQGWDNKDS